MAIAAAHLTTNGSDVDANSFTTASISPTSNALVLAAVAVGKTGAPDTPTLTGNGLTWTLEDSALYDLTGTFGTLFLFKALGASPSAGTLAIAFGGITQLGCVWSIAEFTGVDTSTPIVQSVAEAETDLGNAASVTMAAFSAAENATYGCVAKQTNEGFTPGAGFTELGDFAVVTPVISIMSMWQAANDTVVDASWTTAGEKSGIIGVELKALIEGSQGLPIANADLAQYPKEILRTVV